MNTSDSTPDDSHWSSLAQELGLDSDPAPHSPEPQATPLEVSPTEHAEHLPDAADDDDTMVEVHLSSEPVTEESEAGEGGGDEPGDEGGKRRRRRRRRRRKGGGDAAPNAATTEGGEEPGDEEPLEDEPHVEVKAQDAMHDVIANWNVPSWDELIGGLYRPGN